VLPVTEAGVESTLTWLPLREAISLVVLRLEYTEEYARVWITREAVGDRIKVQGETIEGWDVSILPVAWRGVIDWDAGALRFSEEVINNVKLCLDGLVTATLLPAPKGDAAGREGWPAGQLYSWMIGEISEIGPKILLPAQLQLTRKILAGLITPWDVSKPDEPKQVSRDRFHLSRWRTTIVNVFGELITWPAPKNEGIREYRIIFYANQCKWVFPRLDWLREEAERYAVEVRAGLAQLNGLIALDEPNRTDWTRFVELVAMVGGNLENLTPEESAAVRLVHGFSSVRANAEIHPALHEAEKIRRRIIDRIVEAVRAGQLEVKGRSRSDLKVVVTIPARLVTADQIWSWLRSDELEIAGRHYVDVQIEPSKPPDEPVSDGEPGAGADAGARADADADADKPAPAPKSPKDRAQRDKLEATVTEWLLAGKTKPGPNGKPYLIADAGRYWQAAHNEFPALSRNGLWRALTAARKALGRVRRSPSPKRPSEAKRRLQR
jgi:hypothetical protein